MSTKFRPITHIITGTAPANPWPPTGSYLLCARLYTNTFLDHITLNTVSWYYDGGSSPTYADANCTQQLSNLSRWNDSTANTVLQTIGQNEYGTYVDIFTDSSNPSETAIQFCIILGNDRQQTITDDSWKITRVEVFKVGMTNGVYRTNDNPSKGQWFRNNNSTAWTEFPLIPSSSTKFKPLSVFEVQPAPTIPVVLMPDGKYWTSIDLDIDDGLGEIFKYDNIVINGYTYNNQYFYSPASAKRVAASIPGYHLPTIEEWRNLANSISSSVTTVSNKLRSNYGWIYGNNGTDDYGFTVLPIGNMNRAYTGNASDIETKGQRTCYWCYDDKSVGARHDCVRIRYNNYGIQFTDESSLPQYYFCFKVRLIKD